MFYDQTVVFFLFLLFCFFVLLVLFLRTLTVDRVDNVAVFSWLYQHPRLVSSGLAFLFFLILFIGRAFFFEVYHIPSPSMEPGLRPGDYILVDKSAYGFRSFLTGERLFNGQSPVRGDVVVFRHPKKNNVAYIKRIIGVPGDRIIYLDKSIYLNGSPMLASGSDLSGVHTETFDGYSYTVIKDALVAGVDDSFVVPDGAFFVMGDNRDHSSDSREWGVVADRLLLGKAIYLLATVDISNWVFSY